MNSGKWIWTCLRRHESDRDFVHHIHAHVHGNDRRRGRGRGRDRDHDRHHVRGCSCQSSYRAKTVL